MKNIKLIRLYRNIMLCSASTLLAACNGGNRSSEINNTILTNRSQSVLVEGQACYTAWAAGGIYIVGNLRSYLGNNYTCITAHNNAPANWDPADAPNLWTKISSCGTDTGTSAPIPNCSAWASTSTYVMGTVVTYNSTNYTAKVNINPPDPINWTPDVTWEHWNVGGTCGAPTPPPTPPPPPSTNCSTWIYTSTYVAGTIVTYNGVNYTAKVNINPHDPINWTPDVTWEHWNVGGTCGTPIPPPPVITPSDSRVLVGYFPTWQVGGAVAPTAANLALMPAQVSHVNIAFAHPDFSWSGATDSSWGSSSTGIDWQASNSQTPLQIKNAIAALHSHGIKVLLSIGGWTFRDNFAGLASEAGVTPTAGSRKKALIDFGNYMGLDGYDLDYEHQANDSATVTEYAKSIQALREVVDALGSDKILTAAVVGGGADCTSATTTQVGCSPTHITQLYAPTSGLARLTFVKKGVGSGARGATATIGNMLNIVSIMSYDNALINFDPESMYKDYRMILPANTIVAIGVEVPAEEGGDSSTITIANATATNGGCTTAQILTNNYGVAYNPVRAYSVEHYGAIVANNTTNANSRDGLMMWHVLKHAPSVTCGGVVEPGAADVLEKARSMFSLPTSAYPY